MLLDAGQVFDQRKLLVHFGANSVFSARPLFGGANGFTFHIREDVPFSPIAIQVQDFHSRIRKRNGLRSFSFALFPLQAVASNILPCEHRDIPNTSASSIDREAEYISSVPDSRLFWQVQVFNHLEFFPCQPLLRTFSLFDGNNQRMDTRPVSCAPRE